MKKNGNNLNKGNYYLGLDVGTSSVGWAVTDENYNVLKFRGNAMWGVRLFDEAQDASSRRSSRTARRRIARRNQRLFLLRLLFAEEINKLDPQFFLRLEESALHEEDKSGGKYSLFSDKLFTDKDYYRRYPTIYHLRKELANSTEPHDVRLVYLALHHILKHRGHFLYETSDNGESFVTLASAFSSLCAYLEKEYDVHISPADEESFLAVMERSDLGITAKKKALRENIGPQGESEDLSVTAVCDMLAGAMVSFSELFCDETLKTAEVKSFSLKNNLDDNYDALTETLGERIELLVQMKTVYDAGKLSQILGGKGSISEAKLALYEKYRRDLRLLKAYVRKNVPEKYKLIFSQKKDKLAHYPGGLLQVPEKGTACPCRR